MASNNQEAKKNEIIAKAWKDPTFKKQLLEDPKAALNACGCDIPESMTVHVVEEAKGSYIFVIPASPSQLNRFSDAELESLAAGGMPSHATPLCGC